MLRRQEWRTTTTADKSMIQPGQKDPRPDIAQMITHTTLSPTQPTTACSSRRRSMLGLAPPPGRMTSLMAHPFDPASIADWPGRPSSWRNPSHLGQGRQYRIVEGPLLRSPSGVSATRRSPSSRLDRGRPVDQKRRVQGDPGENRPLGPRPPAVFTANGCSIVPQPRVPSWRALLRSTGPQKASSPGAHWTRARRPWGLVQRAV